MLFVPFSFPQGGTWQNKMYQKRYRSLKNGKNADFAPGENLSKLCLLAKIIFLLSVFLLKYAFVYCIIKMVSFLINFVLFAHEKKPPLPLKLGQGSKSKAPFNI